MGNLQLNQDGIRLEGISEFLLPLYVNEIQSRRVSCSLCSSQRLQLACWSILWWTRNNYHRQEPVWKDLSKAADKLLLISQVMINSLTTKANFPLSSDSTVLWCYLMFVPGKERLHSFSLCPVLLSSSYSSSFPVILQQRAIRASHRQEMGNRLLLGSSQATYNPTGDYRRLQRDQSPPAGFPIKPTQ